MQAYEIVIRSEAYEVARGHAGWCFGLPPGIAERQWPVDPGNGLPLAHGFTIALPRDHRCHGDDVAGLSFFGPSFDVNEGGTPDIPDIRAALADGADEPDDPELRLLWRSRLDRHPRLRPMRDLLDCPYAMILLTAEELHGPPCPPPRLARNRFNDRLQPPAWLEHGGASSLYRFGWNQELFDSLGVVPDDGHDVNFGFDLVARGDDPNAGVAPCSERDAEQTGYEHCTRAGANRWCEQGTILHLGGTLRPVSSGTPRISPHHLEFEEHFGGFNFGGGTMWVDFEKGACDFRRY